MCYKWVKSILYWIQEIEKHTAAYWIKSVVFEPRVSPADI